MVDSSTCRLHELWRANLAGGTSTGTFTSGCQAIWDLSAVPPATGRGDFCTSADAAGLPIVPIVFTADEVASGTIDHAIRFVLPNSLIRADIYVRPGTHSTGATSGGNAAPPYSARLRLKASKDLSGLGAGPRVIAQALKKYGMFLADGGNVTFTAATDALTAHKWSEVGVDSAQPQGPLLERFRGGRAGHPDRLGLGKLQPDAHHPVETHVVIREVRAHAHRIGAGGSGRRWAGGLWGRGGFPFRRIHRFDRTHCWPGRVARPTQRGAGWGVRRRHREPDTVSAAFGARLVHVRRGHCEGLGGRLRLSAQRRSERRWDPAGENIAATAPGGRADATPAYIVGLWAGEWPDFDHATNSCATGKVCGHYTQLVWRGTARVGCARARCTTNSPFGASLSTWDFFVCDYEPPGNYTGQRPY